MRQAIPVVLALLTAAAASGQFVPPVPKGLEGQTALHDRPIPLPHPDQKWIRATSPNFVVISSASEPRTRQITDTLETVAGALRRVHPRFDARFADTTVFVFDRRRDSQPYFELLLNQPKTSVPGAFVVQPDGNAAMVIDATRGVATDRTVKHELMHNILAASAIRLPLWLEEGIAEYFSTTEVRDDAVIIGRPIISHHRILRMRGVLPVEDVLGARAGSSTASHSLFYPQSWALVEWMMRTRRQSFYSFVADVEQGRDVEETFRRLFGMEISTVSRSFRMLTSRPSASNAVQIERTAAPIMITPISHSDALLELGQFLGRMNTTRDDAERYLLGALDLNPSHARSIAGLGTLRAWDRKYEEAEPFFAQAMEIAPDDPEVLTAYAGALLRNALGPFAGSANLDADAPDRLRKARDLIIAALTSKTTPLGEAILGTTYLVEDKVDDGIAPLVRATAARPARLDFAVNLYALLLRAGRESDATALFDSVFSRSKNAQATLVARTVYVREQIYRANTLAEQLCFDEAADVIRDVIDVTPDPVAKAELARDIEKLRRTAAVNRQVTTYNDAVSAYNRRQLETALERLDYLLTFATDDEIRRRAQQLQATVRRRLGM